MTKLPSQRNLKILAQKLRIKSEELNLFSTSDREKLESKHFPDALAILDFWKLKDEDSVLDIGTGGGVPGLVLAAVYPNNEFVLLDSTQKKLSALDEVIAETEMTNVKTLWGRVEELAHAKEREKFDIVTARALAPLPILLEYASGFLKVGGHLYAWKSEDSQEELDESKVAQAELNLEFVEIFNYQLPNGENRSIISFRKTAELPIKYPRKIGTPSKSPLK